jgi:large subunit ribosomal protein L10
MTREEKQQLVDSLTEGFKASQAIVVCDYEGLSVKELETLRNAAREKEVKVKVIKNTLATLAIKKSGVEDIELSGTNIYLWSEDQISACKVADQFSTSMKDKFNIKSGVIEGEVADLARVEAFAKLPGREELLGMLLSVWTAPARNLVTGLDNLRAKKEEEGE